MGGGEQQITRDEWGGTLALLEEIRGDIKDDIRELKKGQSSLSEQLADTTREITKRQDIANGRTTKNEAAVVAAVSQVEAVAKQVGAVQATVTDIQNEGCRRGDRHIEILDGLAAAGVVPDTGEILDRPEGTRWTRRHKAGLGVVGIGGLGLGALVPHIGPFLHWVATLLEKGVRP